MKTKKYIKKTIKMNKKILGLFFICISLFIFVNDAYSKNKYLNNDIETEDNAELLSNTENIKKETESKKTNFEFTKYIGNIVISICISFLINIIIILHKSNTKLQNSNEAIANGKVIFNIGKIYATKIGIIKENNPNYNGKRHSI